MDATERKMTKIAREVSKFTVQTMKEDGIGTAEFDFIHLVRHNPGITQAAVREQLAGYVQRYTRQYGTPFEVTEFADGMETFCKTLDTLYWRTKQERRAGFVNVAKCVEEGAGEDETDTGDSEKGSDPVLFQNPVDCAAGGNNLRSDL